MLRSSFSLARFIRLLLLMTLWLSMPVQAAITAGTIDFTGGSKGSTVATTYKGLDFSSGSGWIYDGDAGFTDESTKPYITPIDGTTGGPGIIQVATPGDHFNLTSLRIGNYSVGNPSEAITMEVWRDGSKIDTVSLAMSGNTFDVKTVNLSNIDKLVFYNNEGYFSIDDLVVAPYTVPLSIGPASPLSNAKVGTAYSQTISASDGNGSYSYSITAGALPAGLSLSDITGVISGTPTAGGSFNFTVTATDTASATGSKAYTLIVDAATLAFSPTTLTAGTVGAAYNQSITVSGGTSTYNTFAIASGALPAGLSLNASTGAITGTPTAGGSFTFTVSAKDSSTGTGAPYSGTSGTISLSIAAPTLAFSPTTLTGGTVGAAYSQNITVSGGTSTYNTYAIASGALPAGLSLNASSGAITGTPTAGGSFTFTVSAKDSSTGTGPYSGTSGTISLSIAAPTITLAPASLPVASKDTAYSQSITASGGTAAYTYAITAGSLPAGLTLSAGGVLSGTPTAEGAFSFTVTATDSSGTPYAGSRAYSLSVNPPLAVANPVSATVGYNSSDSPITLSITGGTATSVAVASAASHGTATASGTSISYTPTADYSGSDSFTYTATNASGTSAAATVSITVSVIAPGAPTGITAIASDSQVTLTFTAPASNGGDPITGYTVTANPGGTTGSGSASPITVYGLNNGTAYTFTVTATNSVGTGPASTPSASVTPKGIQSISFSNPGAQNFGTTPTITATATSGLSVAFSSATPAVCSVAFTGNSAGTSSATLTFLSAGACTIKANQAGSPTWFAANEASLPITVNAIAPGAPTIGTATAGDSSASVTFTTPASTGGASISGYTVTSSPGGLTGTGATSPITVAGLTNGTAYTFTVTATNTAALTGLASAASNSVTPKTNQTITFNMPGAQNFGTTPTLTATTTASGLTPSFTSSTTGVCSITPGGTLTFVATGTCTINADQAGNAGYLPATTVSQSFAVNAVVPGAPTAVTGTAGNTQVSVSFTAPTFTGGASITGYTVTSSPGGFTKSGASSPLVVTGLTNGTSYSFTVTATNSAGTGPASSASSSVAPNVGPPVASAVSATVAHNSSANPITLSIAGGATSVAVVSGASHGTASASGTSITYTPSTAYSGSDSFTYSATNANGTSNAATVTITVTPPAPVANAVSRSVAYNSSANPVTLNITGGTATSVTVASAASHGTATASGTSITYTPASNYSGSDSFTYTATNAAGTSAPATVSITVTAAMPVAGAVNATVAYGSSANTITPALSGGVATSLAIAATPGHGTASVNGLSLRYTPASGYSGSDSFTYTATNSGGTSSAATVTITVAPQVPVASNSTLTVIKNSSANPVSLSLTGGTPTSVTVSAQASHGTATVSATSIVYTPSADYTGSDSFSYIASNAGGSSSVATVTVTVSAMPKPMADAVNASVAYGSSDYAIEPVLSGGAASSLTVTSPPAHGTARASGTRLLYTPVAGYSGSDSFTYTATNIAGTSLPAKVTINVMPQAPVAGDVSLSVVSDSSNNAVPLSISGGRATSVAIVSAPAHGTATVSGISIAYTPAPGYSGSDRFTYTASNDGGSAAVAAVNITVQARPDPSKDPEVIGLINAQVSTAKQFALAQTANFQSHLESLHPRRLPATGKAGLRQLPGVSSRTRQDGGMNGTSAGTESAAMPSSTTSLGTSAKPAPGARALPAVARSSSEDGFYTDAQTRKKTLGGLDLPLANSLSLAGKNENVLGGDMSIWSAGVINLGRIGRTDTRFTTSGISMGVDRRFGDKLILGVGGGFGHERQKIGDNDTRNTGNGYNFSVYSSYQPAPGTFLDGVVGFGRLKFDSQRYASAVDRLATSERTGSQWFVSVSGGYEYEKENLLLSPYVRFDRISTRLDEATESGAGIYNLVYAKQKVPTTKLSLGFRGEGQVVLASGATMRPSFRLEYQHDFENPEAAGIRYADLPSGTLYRLEATGVDRNALLLGLGSDFLFGSGWNMGLRYRFSYGTASSRLHSLGLSIRKNF